MAQLTSILRTSPGASAPRGGLRAWVGRMLVALALLQVLVSSLGLLHQTVHGGLFRSPALHQGADAERPVGLAPAHGHDVLNHLFDGHQQHDDCDWFDRMALGHGLLPDLPVLQAPAPATSVSWTVLALLLRQSPALFWARGPPLHRG